MPADTEITHFEKSGNKVALFYVGGIEIEFMQVYTPAELRAWEASNTEAV
ncbi:MAG: hypothetical protein AAFX92_16935 [Pseudomonadota bacterium]